MSSAWVPPIPRVSSAADLQTSRNVKLEALALHSSQSSRLSAQNLSAQSLSRGHSTASHSSSEKQKASVQTQSNPGTPSEACEQRNQTQAWSDSMYGSGKDTSDDDPSSPKRSSLDEQVASLQERHQMMHNAANSGQVPPSPSQPLLPCIYVPLTTFILLFSRQACFVSAIHEVQNDKLLQLANCILRRSYSL